MRWLISFLLLIAPTSALAAWHKATSPHFVVYGEGTPESVRAYAEKLENFEQVLSAVTGFKTEPEANRLIVFLVENTNAVQRQMGSRNDDIAGFYSPRLWGTIAVVPRRAGDGGPYALDPQTVLFHEYAHHFMLQNAASAYPAWYVEGFAEYFSTTEFERDGSVSVGKPASHRFYGLSVLPLFRVERMLNPDDRTLTPEQHEAFYGWSWLLTHYLRYSAPRKGQFDKYLRAFADGASAADAAKGSFGTIAELQADLTRYRDARRLSYTQMKLTLAKPDIAVATLSLSEGAAMPMFMRSYRASNGKAAVDAVVVEARKLAARFPSEPMALDALAEFELDAEQLDAAQRANTAVLAARPADGRALMRNARIAEARIKAPGTDAEWKAVRNLIVKANRAAPNDPFPLYAYYRWHAQSGTPTPAVAVDGLRRAIQLAPQVPDLRFMLATKYIADGNKSAARSIMVPLLNDPHSAEMRQAARALLEGAKSIKPVETPTTQTKD